MDNEMMSKKDAAQFSWCSDSKYLTVSAKLPLLVCLQ